MRLAIEHILPGDLIHWGGRTGDVTVDTLDVYDTAMLPPSTELTRLYVVRYHKGSSTPSLRPLKAGHMLNVTRDDPEPGPPS